MPFRFIFSQYTNPKMYILFKYLKSPKDINILFLLELRAKGDQISALKKKDCQIEKKKTIVTTRYSASRERGKWRELVYNSVALDMSAM